MKTILSAAFAAVCLAVPAFAADGYSVFRVCEDQHVIRTADGAECGHLEYIVVDPGEQRIVSTVVTGGVLGERHVAVPYSVMRFGTGHDVVLTDINRETIVSAPTIETTRFRTTEYIQPTVIEPTFSHFHVNVNTYGVGGSRTDVRGIDRTTSSTSVGVGGATESRAVIGGDRAPGDATTTTTGATTARGARPGMTGSTTTTDANGTTTGTGTTNATTAKGAHNRAGTSADRAGAPGATAGEHSTSATDPNAPATGATTRDSKRAGTHSTGGAAHNGDPAATSGNSTENGGPASSSGRSAAKGERNNPAESATSGAGTNDASGSKASGSHTGKDATGAGPAEHSAAGARNAEHGAANAAEHGAANAERSAAGAEHNAANKAAGAATGHSKTGGEPKGERGSGDASSSTKSSQ